MTIKEFAEVQQVSYESIRKKIKRYEKELKGHISMQNRTRYLDDYAVDFLKNHMRDRVIIEQRADQTDEMKQLQIENKALLLKIAELQNKVIIEKDKVEELNSEINKLNGDIKTLQEEKIQLLEQPEPEKKHWWNRKK